MIRVAVVDDQQLVREGFAAILEAQHDIEVVLLAEDGRQFVDAVSRGLRPDVALVDIRMPVLDGLAATREVVRLPSPPAVVMVTTFDDDAYVIDAILAGAHGFLLKRCSGRELVEAVRAVAGGDAILSPAVTRSVMARLRAAPAAEEARAAATGLGEYALTAREVEVLALLGAGLTNAEIAERLFLSMSTVKTHVTNVLAKTQCRDRVQAVLLAIRSGIADESG